MNPAAAKRRPAGIGDDEVTVHAIVGAALTTALPALISTSSLVGELRSSSAPMVWTSAAAWLRDTPGASRAPTINCQLTGPIAALKFTALSGRSDCIMT